MGKYTKEDIKRLVEEEDIEFIRLQFTDVEGIFKNLAITTRQLDKALDGRCVFDGNCIEGFRAAGEAEMYLVPDYDTFTIFPWRPQSGKVARFICDIYKPDGEPLVFSPRTVLKNVLDKASDEGYELKVESECEFFLFDLGEDGEIKPYTKENGGYFDVSPLDQGENARREMVMMLEDMGFQIMSSFHEEAKGQHEIDFKYTDALRSADDVMTFKMAVRTIARRHGFHATFMPKPRTDADGSGIHFNFMLYKDGKNVFYDEKAENGLSEEAMSFIAGILAHADEIAAVTNPLVNSYKRLVPGFRAPVYEGWSTQSTSTMIKVPFQRGHMTRIELRNSDPCCNPYLVFALALSAGLEGIKKKLKAPEMIENDPKLSEVELERRAKHLPTTLLDAVKSMEGSLFVKDVLGDKLFNTIIEAKKAEWIEYSGQVSDWELARYLNRF